jgi:hypothetical protein
MSENAGYNLILAFDTDDPEFARGFEAGRMWERVKGDATTWDEMIHASNAEMVMRMCESQDRAFRADVVDDDWVHVWIT